MKKVWKATILAGILASFAAVPGPAFAACRHGAMHGQTVGKQTCVTEQVRDRKRLRDGSCLKTNQIRAGSVEKRGNTYGPGDGTGNDGSGAKDGTGYGAPSKR